MECQEEIGAATKLSQLCKACEHIFTASEAWPILDLDAADGESRLSARNKHIQNKDVLEFPAQRGCRLVCRLLLATIERESETRGLTFTGGLYRRIACFQFDFSFGTRTCWRQAASDEAVGPVSLQKGTITII